MTTRKRGNGRNLIPAFVLRRFDPAERFGLRLTLAAIAVVLVAVPFGLLLDQVVRSGSFIKVDTSAANNLHAWVRGSDPLVAALKVVSFIGGPLWFYLIVGAASVFLFIRKRRRLLFFLLATTLGGGIIDTIVKLAVNRPRPSLEEPVATAFGKSFPSGHAMTSTVCYGALLLIFLPALPRRWRLPVFALTALLVTAIGFSRLALGVHYISDVLGGFVLGLAWLSAATSAFSIWREERGRRPVEPARGLEPEAAQDINP